MYGCRLTAIHLSLILGVVNHSACAWTTTLKLGWITNFDMLSRDGLISLVDEIQFMLISSRHICIRSISSQSSNVTLATTVETKQ